MNSTIIGCNATKGSKYKIEKKNTPWELNIRHVLCIMTYKENHPMTQADNMRSYIRPFKQTGTQPTDISGTPWTSQVFCYILQTWNKRICKLYILSFCTYIGRFTLYLKHFKIVNLLKYLHSIQLNLTMKKMS
jgi:hypothetical protein